MPIEFCSCKLTKTLAKRHCPTLYQYMKTEDDFICGINFGDRLPFDPNPPLYHWAMEDDHYYYIGFAVYHYNDPIGRHRHDCESILLRVGKKDSNFACAVINHLQILFYKVLPGDRPIPYFNIEPSGHGIWYRFDNSYNRPELNLLVYNHFDLSDRYDLGFLWKNQNDKWQYIQEQFGEWVRMPDKYVDMSTGGIEIYVKKEKPIIDGIKYTTSRGLFFLKPNVLFDLAEKANRFKEI